MEQIDSVDIDLDILGQEMLAALEQHDGSATTSEIRDFLGVDSRTKINYRITEFLVPQELITTHQPEAQPGNIPPKELSLTEKGARVLDQLDQDRELNRDAAERITRLEEQVQSLREENQELRERLDGHGGASTSTDELESEIESLQQQIGSLAMELEDVKEDALFQDGVRAELDAVRTGTLAMRDYLFEEADAQDDIVQRSKQYQDEINLLSAPDED